MNEKKLDDKDLFREATRHVKPLSTDKHHFAKKKRPLLQAPLEKTLEEGWNFAVADQKDWLGPEDSLHFARTGLQQKIIQQMKRGNILIEATLDLHRQTTSEASIKTTQFIENCIARQQKWVRIVHGKGQWSLKQKPVLKNFLNQWLREQPSVLAFHSAQTRHGGTGALYVLLKRSKNEK